MPPRLTPPPYLNKEERSLFIDLVTAVDARHFVPSDVPLLVAYIQAALEARKGTKSPFWETAVKMLSQLATKLRLAPQSRTSPTAIARMNKHQGVSHYERMKLDHADE